MTIPHYFSTIKQIWSTFRPKPQAR